MVSKGNLFAGGGVFVCIKLSVSTLTLLYSYAIAVETYSLCRECLAFPANLLTVFDYYNCEVI